jgi:hypothetical protein
MNPDIQAYTSVMEEIKRRTAVVCWVKQSSAVRLWRRSVRRTTHDGD